jgi:hypothetical protein
MSVRIGKYDVPGAGIVPAILDWLDLAFPNGLPSPAERNTLGVEDIGKTVVLPAPKSSPGEDKPFAAIGYWSRPWNSADFDKKSSREDDNPTILHGRLSDISCGCDQSKRLEADLRVARADLKQFRDVESGLAAELERVRQERTDLWTESLRLDKELAETRTARDQYRKGVDDGIGELTRAYERERELRKFLEDVTAERDEARAVIARFRFVTGVPPGESVTAHVKDLRSQIEQFRDEVDELRVAQAVWKARGDEAVMPMQPPEPREIVVGSVWASGASVAEVKHVGSAIHFLWRGEMYAYSRELFRQHYGHVSDPAPPESAQLEGTR